MSIAMNCYVVAWKKYTSDDARWMACRKSEYSRFLGRPWWGIRAIGEAVVWAASGFWLLGHFMRFGTWPHWIYCAEINGVCSEYTPIEDKTTHAIPPMFYRGEERRMNKDRRCADCHHRSES
jgi:hypothetical protein